MGNVIGTDVAKQHFPKVGINVFQICAFDNKARPAWPSRMLTAAAGNTREILFGTMQPHTSADAALLRDTEKFIARFVILPKGALLPLALWAVATHLFSIFDCFPYLAVVSPARRCGKTRLLEVLGLCARSRSARRTFPRRRLSAPGSNVSGIRKPAAPRSVASVRVHVSRRGSRTGLSGKFELRDKKLTKSAFGGITTVSLSRPESSESYL